MTSSVAIIVRNPAHPDEVVGRFDQLDHDELEARLGRAVAATAHWSVAAKRAEALERWADRLATATEDVALLMAREVGKPIIEARAEVERSVAILRYYAQAAFDPIGQLFPTADGGGELRVQRHPLGVVLAITPWNFPLAIPVWKIAPALASGNVVLLKPSSAALATADYVFGLARDVMPDGVLQSLVVDAGSMTSLLTDRRIAGVSFTGSDATGRQVIAAVTSRGGSVQAEMGGQNASIVLEDAPLEATARSIAGAAMAYAGQKCTATSRIIVSRMIAAEFLEALTSVVEALPSGDPLADSTIVGPLINEEARTRVSQAVAATRSRGNRVLTGGHAPDRDGWYWEPTLVAIDDPRDAFAQDEVFGPAASIMVAKDDDAMVELSNGTRYGLSAAVYGIDVARARRLAAKLDVGMIRVNAPTTGVDFHASFGGEKDSSYGPREQGRAALEFYTKTRTLSVYP